MKKANQTEMAGIILSELEGVFVRTLEKVKESFSGALIFQIAQRPFICVNSENPEVLTLSLFEDNTDDSFFDVTIDDLVQFEDGEEERARALEFYKKVVKRFEEEVEMDNQ
jgi:hypothetical protein